MSYMEEVPTRELVLSTLAFNVRKYLDPSLAHSVKIDVMIDYVSHDMVMSLESKIWARQLGTDHLKWPETWLEAFKERWFPRWALRRWPVKYSRYSVQAWHGYPKLAIRSENPRVHLVVTPETGL